MHVGRMDSGGGLCSLAESYAHVDEFILAGTSKYAQLIKNLYKFVEFKKSP